MFTVGKCSQSPGLRFREGSCFHLSTFILYPFCYTQMHTHTPDKFLVYVLFTAVLDAKQKLITKTNHFRQINAVPVSICHIIKCHLCTRHFTKSETQDIAPSGSQFKIATRKVAEEGKGLVSRDRLRKKRQMPNTTMNCGTWPNLTPSPHQHNY